MRKYRKREHVENFLRSSYVGNPLFEDVFLYHNSLPECSFDELNTTTEIMGKKVRFPLMINAMTGGSDFTGDINKSLARIARDLNIPIAVGSETVALEDEESRDSFKCVREIYPDGVVFANLSAHATLEEANFAIELLKADGLQIHLNPAQELVMEEGDRDFSDVLGNIKKLVGELKVPVIVKEVGFGISKNVAEKLYDSGVRYIDVSGFGGTNFFEIENLRNSDTDLSELYGWGIPTAMSLIETCSLNHDDLFVFASGGIKSSLDIVKSLVLGADFTAMSGEILTYLMHGGEDYTVRFLENLMAKCETIMMLMGAKNISELKNVQYTVTGRLRELVNEDK